MVGLGDRPCPAAVPSGGSGSSPLKVTTATSDLLIVPFAGRLETKNVMAASGLCPHVETPPIPGEESLLEQSCGETWVCVFDPHSCSALPDVSDPVSEAITMSTLVTCVTEAGGTPVTLSEVTHGRRALGSEGEQRRSPGSCPGRRPLPSRGPQPGHWSVNR